MFLVSHVFFFLSCSMSITHEAQLPVISNLLAGLWCHHRKLPSTCPFSPLGVQKACIPGFLSAWKKILRTDAVGYRSLFLA